MIFARSVNVPSDIEQKLIADSVADFPKRRQPISTKVLASQWCNWSDFRRLNFSRRLLLGISLLVGLMPSFAIAQSDLSDSSLQTSAPEWLEPRGLSVVDLVGLVPESHLVDTIISSRVGLGIVQYSSGSRNGDIVTVNAQLHPRYWTDGTNWATLFGCLGKPAIGDEWPVAVLPSSMRVYANGAEITSQVGTSFDYVPAGHNWPSNGGSDWWRYEYLWGQRTQFNNDGTVAVPANMGCGYNLPGRQTSLTATFVFNSPNYLTVEEIGSETFIFHSYIGVGNAGHFSKLNEQMNRRFGNRHDKFDLTVPERADYALVKFPSTPVEPYMGQPEINIALPSSGTYRINGSDNTLSVDHVNSMAMPLYGQWQDGDQSGGDFLRFFANPRRLASPEYFVPTSIPYDSCMSEGGCSDALLDQIFAAEMTMTIYYYRIARIQEGLERVALRQVGPSWSTIAVDLQTVPQTKNNLPFPTQSARSEQEEQEAEASQLSLDKLSLDKSGLDEVIYLPVIYSSPPPPAELPEGERNGCPCGWFDSYGRMFDYVSGP